MPRKSTRQNKNVYFQARENAGFTREAASERMDYISADRIERIESEKSAPHPDEVLAMAECYKEPLLSNYYCTNECPIGKKYVPKISKSELAAVVLEIMDSVNGLSSNRDKLIGITADGVITDDERPVLEEICSQLERISSASGTLKIWMENRLQ